MSRIDGSVLPVPDAESRAWWRYAKHRELRVQRCTACGHVRFPPAVMCPECQSLEFDWPLLSGHGTVYSWVVVHHAILPAFHDELPYVVLMVEPIEHPGIRFVGNLKEAGPSHITIGMPVEALFEDATEEITLVHWRPE